MLLIHNGHLVDDAVTTYIYRFYTLLSKLALYLCHGVADLVDILPSTSPLVGLGLGFQTLHK